MKIKLHRDERIIAVVPEYSRGPGWSNAPLWVYIAGQGVHGKSLRIECIQPADQTAEMRTLFAPGAAMASALARCIDVQQLKTFSTDKLGA